MPGEGGIRGAVHRTGLSVFRRLPIPVRRTAVRALTPQFTVGVVVVLERPSGGVLLVRQRHTGRWALPGGLLDRGEGPREALAREVAEELGLTLDTGALDPPGVLVDPAARRVDIVFRTVADVQPRDVGDPETLEAGWYEPTALPQLTGPARDILRSVGLA
jgi:ADP-ribose pyrophosphatase YjhB (NUDIX family)